MPKKVLLPVFLTHQVLTQRPGPGWFLQIRAINQTNSYKSNLHGNKEQNIPRESESKHFLPSYYINTCDWGGQGFLQGGQLFCPVRLFDTPQTVAHLAPQSMEFSRQEYWSGLPFPSPGDLPSLGIETQVSCIAGRCFSRVLSTKENFYFSTTGYIQMPTKENKPLCV